MKGKLLKGEERMRVEETAELFERNLGPLFGLISDSGSEPVMDRLSMSLRKALLLMAMERCSSDPAALCRTLGISPGKLARELRRCGLPGKLTRAA